MSDTTEGESPSHSPQTDRPSYDYTDNMTLTTNADTTSHVAQRSVSAVAGPSDGRYVRHIRSRPYEPRRREWLNERRSYRPPERTDTGRSDTEPEDEEHSQPQGQPGGTTGSHSSQAVAQSTVGRNEPPPPYMPGGYPIYLEPRHYDGQLLVPCLQCDWQEAVSINRILGDRVRGILCRQCNRLIPIRVNDEDLHLLARLDQGYG